MDLCKNEKNKSRCYPHVINNLWITLCKLIMVKYISMDKCEKKEKPQDFVFENYRYTNF